MVAFAHISLCRSVGVSNFGVQQLDGLRNAGRPTPSVNQIELHVFKRQQHIVDYCRQHGIAVMGYSPMVQGHKMNDEKVAATASRSQQYPPTLYLTLLTYIK